MKTKFEIPLTSDQSLKGINLFAVDDYLRSIQSVEDRKAMVMKIGFSASRRAAYEKKNQLPRGAVELAQMLDDRRYREMQEKLTKSWTSVSAQAAPPEELSLYYREAATITLGLSQLYPEAFNFLLQYSLLTQRNRHQFLGDHRFSAEYRVQMVTSWCPSTTPVNCNIFINVGVVALLAIAIGAVALIAIAVAVCFFGPGW